jgi:ubiquitin-conjugating enzyme E2 Q
MKKAGVKSIVMEMRFTSQFPFAPPFIRVVQPRFMPFGQGGGGHVTEGGAICMELLTNTGWSAVSTVEMILLQVRLAMSDEGRPARLATADSRGWGGRGDSYAVGEAVAAYERACRAHGWAIPQGFSEMALGERSGPMGFR